MDANKELEAWPMIFKMAHGLREYGTLAAGAGCNKHEKITIAQERVLGVVFSRYPEGVMLKDIVKELSLSAATISQTIETLVREGLLDRVQSKHDRRAVSIQPTPRCAELRSINLRRFNTLFHDALQTYSQEERDLFIRMMESIIAKTKQYHDCEKKKQSQVMCAVEEKV